MTPKHITESDSQPLLTQTSLEGQPLDDKESSRNNTGKIQGRQSGLSRLRNSGLSRRSVYELENRESDVAFTIVVRKEGADAGTVSLNLEETAVDITHETVNDAVQDAVQDACGQAVQDAVQEAVQDAIQQALEENVRFDVRANIFTLIAITGVILYWRGTWSLWDKLFGFSIWSELGSIATGLIVMITFRLIGVPLLDGLPSG